MTKPEQSELAIKIAHEVVSAEHTYGIHEAARVIDAYLPKVDVSAGVRQQGDTPDMSEEELLAEFRALFNWDGAKRLTAKKWAADNGFSQAYVSDVLHGRRGFADRLAEALGYRRTVTFERLTNQDASA